jgi:hypothetical protein
VGSVLALAVLASCGCTDDTSTSELPPLPAADDLQEAARRTIAAGPAHLTATVRAGRVSYRLRGRWDPTHGYRVCARVDEGPTPYLERRVVWLEGRERECDTLTAHGASCRRHGDWFDDHAPSLELFDITRRPLGGRTGAEDHLHAALLALAGLPGPALVSDRDSPCGASRCHSAAIDFRTFDREPRRRDEDGWTLRPLLRRLGVQTVEIEVGPHSHVERLRLLGPVRVELYLAGFGEERRVPYALASSYE